ncbi:MAG: ThuA domain-containing protein [Planctomycetes bacterium]|nr:ThuA domain-containing protein [Planctomycetota bacterium]
MLRALACLAVLVSAPLALAAEPALRPQELAPGVFALGFSDRLGSANAGWIALGDQVILVGAPGEEALGRSLAAVEVTVGKPVRTVVLTHVREGEAAAARALLRRGIEVVVQREAAKALRASLGADLPPAAKLREAGDRLVLGDGGDAVDVLGWDLAAGPGNAAVFARRTQVLFAGELCVSGPKARLDRAHVGLWIEALAALQKLPAKRVVPGFGTAPRGVDALERQERFLRELRRQVAYGIVLETPLAQVQARVFVPPEHLVWMPYDNPTPEDAAILYRELTIPEAPYGRRPFAEGDPRPRALALIGDRYHDPEHLEAGLSRAFEAAGVAARFTVDVRALSAESLKPVRVLVILRDGMTWPEGPEKPYRVWMAPEQERAVVDFVESGGALLALHNSTGLYPEGGPYLKLLGGTYNGHGPLERFRVRVLDAAHPIVRGVAEYEIADEQHTPVPDLARVHVILESRSEEGVVAPAGWVREAGRGRVCYLANGHTREALVHPEYQRLLQNALRWCLGVGGR